MPKSAVHIRKRVRAPHFASKVSYNAGAAKNVTMPSNPL